MSVAPDIETALLTMIRAITGRDTIDAAGLLESGTLDSLNAVELLTQLEAHFGCHVPTDELTHHNFNSVAALAALVERCRATAHA